MSFSRGSTLSLSESTGSASSGQAMPMSGSFQMTPPSSNGA